MKKKLSRYLLANASNPAPAAALEEDGSDTPTVAQDVAERASTTPKPAIGGAGSAWKSGAAAQSSAELARSREKTADDILNGGHEIQLSPDQITDEIGSDRRDDWKDQDAFQSILESIKENGQDTPIQVWPKDPNWTPDKLDPENINDVPFLLIIGRRRREIAKQLGRPVRAILASPEKRGSPENQFEMLFMRFRENAERENLGPFEHLLSIGEMYESLKDTPSGAKLTAKNFAKRINEHQSIVSRGRAVLKAKDQLLNIFNNAYDLSYPELQKAVASLSDDEGAGTKKPAKSKKILIIRKIGNRKLQISSQGGKLSVSAAGLKLDKQRLEGLGDVIAVYLEKNGSDKKSVRKVSM